MFPSADQAAAAQGGEESLQEVHTVIPALVLSYYHALILPLVCRGEEESSPISFINFWLYHRFVTLGRLPVTPQRVRWVAPVILQKRICILPVCLLSFFLSYYLLSLIIMLLSFLVYLLSYYFHFYLIIFWLYFCHIIFLVYLLSYYLFSLFIIFLAHFYLIIFLAYFYLVIFLAYFYLIIILVYLLPS